ncbi:MAG: hypothetical protein KGD63_03995 [Candidatus Lokiarchaeota archaeon]|nr:hypothetical protein [Candidatus Lokiarchaeota archaeon]
MTLGKRKKILYFMVIFYTSLIAVLLFGLIFGLMPTGNQLISFLPIGNSLIEYLIVVIILYPLSMVLGCLIGQYVMFPFYILIHIENYRKKNGICYI